MKRVLLISLAVLMAVSLSITVLPAQSVKADVDHDMGVTWNVNARGLCGVYDNDGNPLGDGEFHIRVNGNFTPWPGYAQGIWARVSGAGGGGHLEGSFDGNELSASLRVKHWSPYPVLNATSLWADYLVIKAKLNGDEFRVMNSDYMLDWSDPDNRTVTVIMSGIANGNYVYFKIIMHEADADLFKFEVREIGMPR